MSERYEVRDDTVLDHQTGLVWQREHSGPMTWDKAMSYAANLGDGWRLPTIEELIGLIEYTRVRLASSFPAMPPTFFWSSSSCAGGAAYAWYVSFILGNGYYLDKSGTYCVRCVRRGPRVGVTDGT